MSSQCRSSRKYRVQSQKENRSHSSRARAGARAQRERDHGLATEKEGAAFREQQAGLMNRATSVSERGARARKWTNARLQARAGEGKGADATRRWWEWIVGQPPIIALSCPTCSTGRRTADSLCILHRVPAIRRTAGPSTTAKCVSCCDYRVRMYFLVSCTLLEESIVYPCLHAFLLYHNREKSQRQRTIFTTRECDRI